MAFNYFWTAPNSFVPRPKTRPKRKLFAGDPTRYWNNKIPARLSQPDRARTRALERRDRNDRLDRGAARDKEPGERKPANPALGAGSEAAEGDREMAENCQDLLTPDEAEAGNILWFIGLTSERIWT
jgi:hypothetical protein